MRANTERKNRKKGKERDHRGIQTQFETGLANYFFIMGVIIISPFYVHIPQLLRY